MLLIRRLAAATLLTCACAAPNRPTSPSDGPRIDPGLALATFDTLWAIVHDTYVDTAFVRERWIPVRDTVRPRAAAVTTRRALDRVLAEALQRISDSHFYLIPASVAFGESEDGEADGRGTTGLTVRVAEGNVVAWRVSPSSAAARAGITPGQRIARIGTRHLDSALAQLDGLSPEARQRALAQLLQRLNGALAPAVGDTVRVELERGGGSASSLLVADAVRGTLSRFGNLPPIVGVVTASRVALADGGCAGVIAFNIWLPALVPELERAVDSVRTCAGIVVDLRGNPGGVGGMVMGFGGYFVDSVVSLGTMRMRQLALNFVINPQRSRRDGTPIRPFTGPMAIIVDPASASTSEIFAAGMQRIQRARVFGERSAGAALPSLMNRLPSDDVFVHAVADFTGPDGKRIEGAGVEPDEVVPLTIADLASGRDAPVAAALRWIQASRVTSPRE